MRLLLTNDDGVSAPGLKVLEAIAQEDDLPADKRQYVLAVQGEVLLQMRQTEAGRKKLVEALRTAPKSRLAPQIIQLLQNLPSQAPLR